MDESPGRLEKVKMRSWRGEGEGSSFEMGEDNSGWMMISDYNHGMVV